MPDPRGSWLLLGTNSQPSENGTHQVHSETGSSQGRVSPWQECQSTPAQIRDDGKKLVKGNHATCSTTWLPHIVFQPCCAEDLCWVLKKKGLQERVNKPNGRVKGLRIQTTLAGDLITTQHKWKECVSLATTLPSLDCNHF